MKLYSLLLLGTAAFIANAQTPKPTVCPSAYHDLPDRDFPGNDIGRCGIYNTVAAQAAACTANKSCQGFSIIDEGQGYGAGQGPWCLKSNVKTGSVVKDHHFCMKKAVPIPNVPGTTPYPTVAATPKPVTPKPTVYVPTPSPTTVCQVNDGNKKGCRKQSGCAPVKVKKGKCAGGRCHDPKGKKKQLLCVAAACSTNSKGGKCGKQAGCYWDRKARTCMTGTRPPANPACAKHQKKGACNSDPLGCLWNRKRGCE